MPLHVSIICVHHQEVKIALHSLWYHHTETSEWSKITKIQFYTYEQIVVKFMCEFFWCDYCVLLNYKHVMSCRGYVYPAIKHINPSAWGHLNPSSYCDVGRLFYGVFKLWSKLQRKK